VANQHAEHEAWYGETLSPLKEHRNKVSNWHTCSDELVAHELQCLESTHTRVRANGCTTIPTPDVIVSDVGAWLADDGELVLVPTVILVGRRRVLEIREDANAMTGRMVQQPVEAGNSVSVIGTEHGEEGAAVIGGQGSPKTTAGVATDAVIMDPAISESVFVLLISFPVVRFN